MLVAQSTSVELVTNQLLLLATIVGAIAALPALIEFVVARRKRQERVQLSMDDEVVSEKPERLAGYDGLLDDIADLIDRAKHPSSYHGLALGNELLIIGPPLSGKKRLARRIAQLAGMQRMITIYNPRNSDALAHAKGLLKRATTQRIMLLLPSLDQVFDSSEGQSERDEEVEAELDALIETVANRPNVLIIATACRIVEGDDLDNLFGMKVVLPGAPPITRRKALTSPEHQTLLREVASMYLHDASVAGCPLQEISQDEAIGLLLAHCVNPAEVQDAIEAARTRAVYLHRTKGGVCCITKAVLAKGVQRVVGHGEVV